LNGKATAEHNAAQSAERKAQTGSGMRGDKIRTYRFQDDIVKDHNSGKSASVDKVMAGNFNLLW
jgi:peptide chain release factor 1